MKLSHRLFSGALTFATAITMAGVSRAAESSASPDQTKPRESGAVVVSLEPVVRMQGKDGGQLTQILAADALVVAPAAEHWDLYFGPGLGIFQARFRAGAHAYTAGRSRSGPVLMLGGRATAGFLMMDSPESEAPPATQSGSATWSYTALLVEAGAGWRFLRERGAPDFMIVPTLLAGRVHYATGGVPLSARTWSGTSVYVGGTVALALEF